MVGSYLISGSSFPEVLSPHTQTPYTSLKIPLITEAGEKTSVLNQVAQTEI